MGAYVIDNLSLDSFRQVDKHYTHLRSVPGSLGLRYLKFLLYGLRYLLYWFELAVWFEVPEILFGA